MCAWSPGSGGWVAPPPRLQALLGEAPRRVGGPVSSPEEAQADRLPRRRPRPFRVRVVHWRLKVWMQSRQVDDAIAPLARVREGLCPAGQNKPYGQHYPHVGYHLPQTDIMVYPYMPSVCLFPLGVWQACPFFRQTKACSHGLVAPFRHLGRAAQARQPTSLCVCRGDFGPCPAFPLMRPAIGGHRRNGLPRYLGLPSNTLGRSHYMHGTNPHRSAACAPALARQHSSHSHPQPTTLGRQRLNVEWAQCDRRVIIPMKGLFVQGVASVL